MNRLLVFVVIVAIGVGILGYSRGWFDVTKEGNVAVDREKFEQDKLAFKKMVGERAKALKESVANLWKKTKLSGADKESAQKELDELHRKHDKLEAQLRELREAGEQRFESLKKDLESELADVEKRSAELMKKLDKKS
ncbi:MAG: hypothetical protein FJ271_08765 [Planctomycetes bacterium]|nr:hypothetical protein [Planctomycetota bacterium]